MTDPRPGCADHLCQAILTDSGKHRFGSALLAKMSEQQEDPSQTFFTRVEKLVHEIRFVSDVTREQMRDEQFRDLVPLVKHAQHQQLLDPEEIAICDRCGRCHAQRLACQASLAEELTGVQCGDDRFLALLGYNGELHLALSKIEYAIRGLSLSEDAALRAVFRNGLPAGDSSERGFPIDRQAFLAWHDNLLTI